MTIKDTMTPGSGVVVFESVQNPMGPKTSSLTVGASEKPAYQVLKRGKPFQRKGTDQASPRMTRDSYFKLAESQGLSTMRDEIISIMGPSQTENMLTTRQSGGFPA